MSEKTVDEYGREILEERKIVGIRKLIAERMRESLDRSPQGTGMLKVDVSSFVDYRKKLIVDLDKKISYSAMFIKAAGCILEDIKIFNSARIDDKIITYKNINIGLAAYVNNILCVPVIKDVQNKDVVEISDEIRAIVQKLQNQDFAGVQMAGSNFTVNNLGTYEMDGFTPFIQPPEVGILGIGRTRREVTVDEEDNILIKPMTTLSLTNDHAVVDGVPVAKFFEYMQTILQYPEQYLMNTIKEDK
jgi:pyruvate dehydrogenase E2 component (dihydrolipoamide acetyltransferase)